MRWKQELTTTAELASGVLKREQLKRGVSQQAKAVCDERSSSRVDTLLTNPFPRPVTMTA